MPPTTFEYQGVTGIAQTAAPISKIKGESPLPNGIDPENSLPYLDSVAVLDFNGDGLSDIVQSWNAERSIESARPIIGYENVGLGPPDSPYNINVYFAPQCMDAGRIDDPTGLTQHNIGLYPGFLSSSAVSLIGSWGEGTVAWSNANYAPYRARPLVPEYELRLIELDGVAGLPTTGNSLVIVAKIGDFYQFRIFDKDGNKIVDKGNDEFVPDDILKEQLQSALNGPPLAGSDQQNLINSVLTALKYSLPFEAGSGCDSASSTVPFSILNFHPSWKWEQTEVNLDWAKAAVGEPDPFVQRHLPPRWFADIDGDGWIDRLIESGASPLGNFQPAIVEFTSVYGKGDKPAIPGSVADKPAEIPFVWNGDEAISLAPKPNPPPHTRFYYVDMDGDGLVDLVEYSPAFSKPRVRLGDGRGHFSCDQSKEPWPCLPSNPGEVAAYEIENAGPPNLFNAYDEDIFFHDVTGDGLADLVKYDKNTGTVSVWVNVDGHKFVCLSYTPNCYASTVLDERTGSPDIGEHKITFADMDGDGTDDLVILTHRGAYIVRFMPTNSPVLRGGASKPGLLTRIHDGHGATTDIQYHALQQIDQQLKNTPLAWKYHAPVVENVVTQIVTQNSRDADGFSPLPAPFNFKRKKNYLYLDPAYDRWSRSLAGFRKIIIQSGDENSSTSTIYWFGPCQNNLFKASLLESADPPFCPDGSDDDPYKSLAGKVVRIDRDRGDPLLNALYQDSLIRTHGPNCEGRWT